MTRAKKLLIVHEEIEKEVVNYMKKGNDWSSTPVDLTLQGSGGYSYNDNRCPEHTAGKYYPDGKRPIELKRLAQ